MLQRGHPIRVLLWALFLGAAVSSVRGGPHSADSALLFKGHLRHFEELAGFWKWFVDTENVDVFIVTQSPTVDKSGIRTPVNVSLVKETFGKRLKLLHIIEEGTVEHQFLEADMVRVAAYLPDTELTYSRKRSPARHYVHFWLVHRMFEVAGAELSKYKRIAAVRTDYVQATVGVDPADLTYSAGSAQKTVVCPRNPKAWQYFKFMTQLKELEPLVRQHPHWGFSVSDYFYYGPPETLRAMSFLRDWMWVRIPPEGSPLRRPGSNPYASEGQFYLQRVVATNMTDLRDLGVATSTVVVREAVCEARHSQPQLPFPAEAGVHKQLSKFAVAQGLAGRSGVLWADPSFHHRRCVKGRK